MPLITFQLALFLEEEQEDENSYSTFVLLLTGCAAEPANQRNLLTQFVGNNAPVDPEPSPVLVNIRNVLTGG